MYVLEASSQAFVSHYRAYYVSTDNVLCVYVKRNIIYKRGSLRLAICVCYMWQMVLIVGLDVTFVNM
jgi:hypothetical protein